MDHICVRIIRACAGAGRARKHRPDGAARAETFDFSYTFDDGGLVSGVVEGNVQPDLNTVLVYSIDNLVVFGETIAPAVVGDYIYSPPGSVTFDGSSMNFAAADSTLTSGFNVETLFPPTVAFARAPSGSQEVEVYDSAHWSLTLAAVPEPATWALMLAGFGALGAFGYRTQGRRPRTAA